jgi:hypothetical protein
MTTKTQKPAKLPLIHLEYGTYPLCGQRGKVTVMTEGEAMERRVRICSKCSVIFGNTVVDHDS